MEKDAFDVAVFYWHTIMTYSSILSIAHILLAIVIENTFSRGIKQAKVLE